MKHHRIEIATKRIQTPQETCCLAAWNTLVKDPSQTVAEAARSVDLAPHVFTRWIGQHHRGELFVLRIKKGLSLRGGNGQPSTP